MPSRTLPTFTKAEVQVHNSAESCYVTIGAKVFDVTDFVDSHPGGPELILGYAGKDIEDILKEDSSHTHSDSAYEMLEEFHVGFVVSEKSSTQGANGSASQQPSVDENGKTVHPRTGMSCEDDLSKETDFSNDYKTHKFLDLGRPLFPQIWFGGFSKAFYLEQVHRPRHYKGGQSAPIFGNFLEPLSKTPWWAIPLLWLPVDGYLIFMSSQGLPSLSQVAAYWAFGLFIWTFLEYLLHRFLFHLDDHLPDNRVFISLHFLLHGVHHYLPMDKYRLVMPPVLFSALAYPFWRLAHFLFSYSWYAATAVFCGGLFGYVCYDLTHYFLHHQNLPSYYKTLKKLHLEHHFLDYELGFGVTSPFWDKVFGTELVSRAKKA